jgi:anti-sigma factor RsiW
MSKPIDPQTLLAAYADGAVHGEERQAVLRYLEQHPQAAAEVEEMRLLLAQARSEDVPGQAPSWDKMSANILAETAVQAPPAQDSVWWQRPQTALYGVMAAALVLMSFFVLSPQSDKTTAGPPPSMVDTMQRSVADRESNNTVEIDTQAELAENDDEAFAGFELELAEEIALDTLENEDLEAIDDYFAELLAG